MFGTKKFGLTDSIIDAVKSVVEGKVKEYGVDTERELAAKGEKPIRAPKKPKKVEEVADPAGSPAGGRQTNAMDARRPTPSDKYRMKNRKGDKNLDGKVEPIELTPNLKEMTMKERTAFHMAAAAAKRTGKSHFMFGGKKFPVKMSADAAREMTSEEAVSEERWINIKTKAVVQAPDRDKAAQLLNTKTLYIRKAPASTNEEKTMTGPEVTRAHKIGKHFKKKGVGDEPYALATWMTLRKPSAAKKAEKTIEKKKD